MKVSFICAGPSKPPFGICTREHFVSSLSRCNDYRRHDRFHFIRAEKRLSDLCMPHDEMRSSDITLRRYLNVVNVGQRNRNGFKELQFRPWQVNRAIIGEQQPPAGAVEIAARARVAPNQSFNPSVA